MWSYPVAALAALALIRVVGEPWWVVTLLLFCPRWAYLAPAAVLAPAACLARRPGLLPAQAAAVLVVSGPLMGFSVPWDAFRRPTLTGPRVRVLVFNQHRGAYRAEDLIRLIERYRVDVLCLQEVVENPTLEAYLARGWYRDSGRGIASRFPVVREFDPEPYPFHDPPLSRVVVRTPAGAEFVVDSVHLPSMRPGFRSLRRGDFAGMERAVEARRAAMTELAYELDSVGGLPAIVAGDFNATADSSLFDPLRERFLVGFERAGRGYGYTWPAGLPGIRIDHVLASPDWEFTDAVVGPDLGSDHRPVIAEVVLTPVRATRPR